MSELKSVDETAKIFNQPQDSPAQKSSLNIALIDLLKTFDKCSRNKVLKALNEAEAIVDLISHANKLAERLRRFEKGEKEDVDSLLLDIHQFTDVLDGKELSQETLKEYSAELKDAFNQTISKGQLDMQVAMLKVKQCTEDETAILEILSVALKMKAAEIKHIVSQTR